MAAYSDAYDCSPPARHIAPQDDLAAIARALVELYPDLAPMLHNLLTKTLFVMGVAFFDSSNLGSPGHRRVTMTLTFSGTPGSFLVQAVYLAKRRPGRPDTLATRLYVKAADHTFNARAKNAPSNAPSPLVPHLGTLRLPKTLEPLLPLLHKLACTPFHLLAPILTGTLQASLRTTCPSLFASPSK